MTGKRRDMPDALSRALMKSRPELAGHVHYVNGRPWCDGINHTTMCQPGSEEHDMSEPASEAGPASLAEHDRLTVDRARQLAGISSAAAVREYTGHADTAMAYFCAFGETVFLLRELAAIVERLAGDAHPRITGDPP